MKVERFFTESIKFRKRSIHSLLVLPTHERGFMDNCVIEKQICCFAKKSVCKAATRRSWTTLPIRANSSSVNKVAVDLGVDLNNSRLSSFSPFWGGCRL